MINFFQAIVLGIVEGLSEFLPISSTAHLDFARQLMGIVTSDFVKSFEIIIQVGAILAVLIIYRRLIIKHFKTSVLKLLAAFIPTAVLGLIFYKIIKTYLLGNDAVMIAALLIGGLALIVFEHYHKEKPAGAENSLHLITYKQAVIIGLAQSLAMIPGTSRSAATIVGGLALGIPRAAIVEFSFLLAIPTMLAAAGLDLIKTNLHFSSSQWLILTIGLIASFASALAVIRWFLAYIRRHNFSGFGWYRLALGLVLILWLWLK